MHSTLQSRTAPRNAAMLVGPQTGQPIGIKVHYYRDQGTLLQGSRYITKGIKVHYYGDQGTLLQGSRYTTIGINDCVTPDTGSTSLCWIHPSTTQADTVRRLLCSPPGRTPGCIWHKVHYYRDQGTLLQGKPPGYIWQHAKSTSSMPCNNQAGTQEAHHCTSLQ